MLKLFYGLFSIGSFATPITLVALNVGFTCPWWENVLIWVSWLSLATVSSVMFIFTPLRRKPKDE